MELGRCGRWKLIAGRKPTTSRQAIGFEAPSQRSLGNCPELGRRPGTGLTGSVFAAAHHFAHRSEEHTSELQSPCNLVCRLLLEKKTSPHHPAQSGLRRTSDDFRKFL